MELNQEKKYLEEPKKYCIYKHTFPNGKVYIGQTCQIPEKRWDKGRKYKTQIYLWRAIQKYGWENIKHDILEENLSQQKANELEDYYIVELYKSNNKKYGYNLDRGGRVNCHGLIESNDKRKIPVVINGIKYNSLHEASRKLNINRNKVKSLAGIGKYVKNKVYCPVEINGIKYKSLRDAERTLKCARSKIKKLCGIDEYVKYNKGNSRPIVLNNINYLSVIDASRKLGISKKKIYKMLKEDID